MQTEDNRLMTTNEVAQYLAVPVSRVYDNWRSWGLPAIKFGNQLRFRRSEIDRWLDSQRVTESEAVA
ncbi:helix-turn-helix domain-containing protein [Actinoplanes sp. URMC 104]|uniref:helix-turn-helix domain-containing protein n=1 Tax=Actinoplanes sp. URMC 104 TaxID=3423409 RepID=UPI003F1D476C